MDGLRGCTERSPRFMNAQLGTKWLAGKKMEFVLVVLGPSDAASAEAFRNSFLHQMTTWRQRYEAPTCQSRVEGSMHDGALSEISNLFSARYRSNSKIN